MLEATNNPEKCPNAQVQANPLPVSRDGTERCRRHISLGYVQARGGWCQSKCEPVSSYINEIAHEHSNDLNADEKSRANSRKERASRHCFERPRHFLN